MTTMSEPAGTGAGVVADPRRISYLPIAELVEDPRNPKNHDDDAIDSSIGRFGMLDPIVRDERTGRIVSGHGRRRALAEMEAHGESAPEGVRVDPETGKWLVPVVTGWASRTDTEAAAALIALNRTTELGGWADEQLLELLDELSAEDDGLAGVGYTDAEILALQKSLESAPTMEELADGWDEGDQEADSFRGGDGGPESDSDGALLDMLSLSSAPPEHETRMGDHWTLGRHHLFVVDPLRRWEIYTPTLQENPGCLFAPFPDTILPMAKVAAETTLVMVQPSRYLSGHLLDKFASVFEEPVELVHREGEGSDD